MQKLEALRAHLLAAVPDLTRNPDKLMTFANDGRVQFHRGQHLSHEYSIDAQIIVTDYHGTLDVIVVPLLQWLARYQPDVDPQEAVQIEAEIIDSQRYDVALTVQLTERVVALVDCEAGRINAHHRMPEYTLEPCPAENWKLYVKGPHDADYDLKAEWSSP